MPRANIGNQRIDLERARNRLATVWYGGALIAVLIAIAQSITNRFDSITQDFWSWFTPTIFPTVALITGVIAGTALDEDRERRTVKRFFFRVALGLSLVYLLVLIAVMLAEPFAGTHDMHYFTNTTIYLSPMQGVVLAAIGALFNSRKRATDAETEVLAPKKPKRRRAT